MEKYDPKLIESKWQQHWEENNVYRVEDDASVPKYYVLDMFPYPSGAGLHVGHPKGYIATDIFSRFKKMSGYNVLHPMGWDAFGLPAENYAIKHKVQPQEAVEKNVEVFKAQFAKIGFNFDWSREINTTDPEYYKWTQWCVGKMFEKGLMEEVHEPIIWCPECKTGLALEDLEDGKCERCGSVVEKKPLRQWVIKITEYADRLLEDLDDLDWEDNIKEMQRHWIGRSEGAEIEFNIRHSERSEESQGDSRDVGDASGSFADAQDDVVVTAFTTRPDTLFGVTYMVLAPEHPLIHELERQITNLDEVKAYVKAAASKTDLDREKEKEKTGVKLEGVTVEHPVTGEAIPVYIADYVMMGYGTGAIMAVPAHDERDFAFAKKYGIEIAPVVLKSVGEQRKGENDFEGMYGILERDGEIFVMYETTKDLYRLPGGTKEVNESDQNTLLREFAEETGYVNVTVEKHVGDINVHFISTKTGKPKRFVRRGYSVSLKDEEKGELADEDKGAYEYMWLTKDEAFEAFEKNKTSKYFPHDTGEGYLVERYFGEENVMTECGVAINSDFLNGLSTEEAKSAMIDWLEKNKKGERKIQYKLRDWVFARQRYWGEPFPFIHKEDGTVEVVPESELPVTLPAVEAYEPTGTGESPLSGIEEWINVPGGKRETNTMPQWAGSSWYYLRYIDPNNNDKLVDADKEKYWMGDKGVDLYVGGTEHATRHLIYARFWHKFLFDMGVVTTKEPFNKLINVGLIMAEDGRKMSKRWGNVINPDDVIEQYGADSFRLYEMFIGPFTQSAAWNTRGVEGVHKFLQRYSRLYEKTLVEEAIEEQEVVIHQTIKKVTEEIEKFQFNTAISQMMIAVNELTKAEIISKSVLERLNRVLAPFAVYLTEELHQIVFEGRSSIHHAEWPSYDESKLVSDTITLAVQVNGKVRANITVATDANEEDVKAAALAEENVAKWLEGGEPKKLIYVKGKIVNVVV